MSAGVRFLADVSVVTRLGHPEVAQVLGAPMGAGQVGTCGVLDLCLYAAVREGTDLPTVAAYRSMVFPWLATDDRDLHRALQVQALIAETGQRLSAWSALVVAAVAERHQVTLLHYSVDFDLLAKVTGQDTRWVVPAGSLSEPQAQAAGRDSRPPTKPGRGAAWRGKAAGATR